MARDPEELRNEFWERVGPRLLNAQPEEAEEIAKRLLMLANQWQVRGARAFVAGALVHVRAKAGLPLLGGWGSNALR